MANRRHVQRRRVLSSLLGGLVVGSGCVERSNSGSGGTTGRETSTTASLTTATTESTTKTTTTTTETTTETTTTTTETTTTPRKLTYELLELANRPIIGDRNAPVTMVYWGDYRCPYCQRWEIKTLPKIHEKLITSGKLRVIFKPVPLFGKKSERVARACHCVWNQVKDEDRDAFWRWQANVLETGYGSHGWTDRETLVELADRSKGVSGDELASCLRSGRYADRVSNDFSEGKQWDLEGTPHYLIFGDDPNDGTTVTGTVSLEWTADTVEEYR